MAFVHHNSCECTKSELDLFSVPPTQVSIEKSAYVEYHPVASLSDNNGPIEFSVSANSKDYLDLANTYLFVKAKITKANGADIVNDSHVAPVNNTLHSLFSDIDIKLNGTLITASNGTYPYRCYLENLLSLGQDAKKSQLTSCMYYEDVAGKMDDNNPHADTANPALKKRYSYFAESRVCDMIGRIHSDLFFQDKLVPSNVGMDIRLVRNKDAFVLMAHGAEYKMKIIECILFVKKVSISPSIFLAHQKTLETSNAKFPMNRVECKTFTCGAGNLSVTQEKVFTGQIPTRIVIGFVDNDSFNGSFQKSPFNFKNYNLSFLNIFVDDVSIKVNPIEVHFENNNYIQGYMSQFLATGKLFKDEGTTINRDDFKHGYAIYAFDLKPDMGDRDHFNLIREGDVRVEAKFNTALENTINAICYAEFENIIEINGKGNVSFDYKNN